MAGVNKVILLGNLGKDPVVRTLESGAKVASFSLATSRTYKGQDGNPVEETEWHNVSLWGNLADLAEKYLTKGRQVFIEGRLRTRQYDDKEGNKRYTTEVVGENMTFVGSRPDGQGGSSKGTAEPPADLSNPMTDDDLPF
jgi:single-strand DNA-binding protein